MFNWNKFSDHEECTICMEAFTDADQVTPLPCDRRHYFHTSCIQQWSAHNNSCPLCKKEFDGNSLAESLKNRSTVKLNNPQDEEENPFLDKKQRA